VAVALVGGCATPVPGPPPASSAAEPRSPVDLAIDVTVLPGAKVNALRGDDAPAGVLLLRTKYVLLADGSLRAEVGEGVEVLVRPGRVRTLTMEEVADLWLFLESRGLSAPRDDLYLGNPALLAPRPDEVLTIVTVTADGWTRSILERRVPTAPSAADAAAPPGAVADLVRQLAALAWFGGVAPEQRALLPERYDFGPTPYDRYLPAQPGRQAPTREAPAIPALGPDTAVERRRPLSTPVEPGAQP